VTPAPSGGAPERTVLSRDLADLLVELSIALHKHAMYPSDHPSLPPAAEAVVSRAERLLADRATVSLGVARHQLVIEGVATDPKHPILRELADRLHRHHLGAITLSRGITGEEVRDVLRVLAVEADRTGRPLGLGPSEDLRRWAHVRLYPLTYERLELVDEAAPPDASVGAARARGAQLWIGLARAALATEGTETPPPSTEPAVIARAIDERSTHGTGAYDQAIVGYLLQIAEELKGAGSSEAVALRRRMARLVRSMKPETLRRLVAMGGDSAQRRKFVADAADGMALDAVIAIVQAAADSSQQTISHALVRMLSKLAAHAEGGSPEARPQADAALRDQVRRLLAGWSIPDPNPGAYGAALDKMSRAAPMFAAPLEESYPTEPDRIAAMGLELDLASGSVLEAADRIAESALPRLLEALEQMPASSEAASRLWTHVANPETIRRLATKHPVAFPILDRLVPRAGVAAADPLLDAVADTDSRGERRGLMALLARLGPGIGPSVVGRLDDTRWYVTRNMLALLEEIGGPPDGFSALPWLAHTDGRVRLQALKLQLKLGAERGRAFATALRDPDPRVVQTALIAAHGGCPEAVLPLVASHATDRSLAPNVRVLAIRALGGVRSQAARDTLLGLTKGSRTLFGRDKLPPKSPELLAALATLAARWANDSAARRVLARAAGAKDPEIRAAAVASAQS
jgi:hypothetical protein